MADQLMLYDATLASWVAAQFGSLITDKPIELIVGTPDRAFADYTSHITNRPYGQPKLPRMALTIGDPSENQAYFNSSIIRKLGYTDSHLSVIRQATYPTPITIPYTLNFWTEYRREMNLLVQKLLQLWRYHYVYIPVDFDSITTTPVYGTKEVGLFAAGGVSSSGSEEPVDGAERIIRRTFGFDMRAWLWDFDFQTKYTVKEVQFNIYRDDELTLLTEIARVPPRYTLATVATSPSDLPPYTYSYTLSNLPVIPQTMIVDAIVLGSNVRAFDNGYGVLVGTGASGTINYTTGALRITYAGIPDNGSTIETAYFTTTP